MKNGDNITYLNFEDEYVPDFVTEVFQVKAREKQGDS